MSRFLPRGVIGPPGSAVAAGRRSGNITVGGLAAGLVGLAVAAMWIAGSASARADHEHAEVMGQSPYSYQIFVGGTLDHLITRKHEGYFLPWEEGFQPNCFLSVENIGRVAIHNPRIVIDGRGGWGSRAEIVDSVLEPGMTSEEKALALWAFMVDRVYRVDQSFHLRYLDPVVALNTYGFGDCIGRATHLGHLAEEAGLEAAVSGPGHWTANLSWEGESHFFDPDRATFFYRPRGAGLAGEASLVIDHHLVRLTHTDWVGHNDHPSVDSAYAELFDAMRYREELYSPFVRDMSLSLRPGETIYRSWENWGKFSSYGFGPHSHDEPPPYFGNGEMIYRPDLTDTLFREGAEEVLGLSSVSEGGLTPNIHPSEVGVWGRVILRMESPYVIVGGKVRGSWMRRGEEDQCRLLVSPDGLDWELIWAAADTGRLDEEIDLDAWVDPHETPPRFEFRLRFDFLATEDITHVGLDSLLIEADFQLAPVFLPSLVLATNVVQYTDDNEGERTVRVVHGWDESSATHPPAAPRPAYPEDGGSGVPLRPVFGWDEPSDPDGDAIIDYEVQVSERADFRWPVSPNFDRYLSRTPYQGRTQWVPPHDGLLEPGALYRWRVRAQDEGGAWGPWSAAGSFTTSGPGRPDSLSIVVEGKRMELSWQPASEGTAPTSYLVYGSDEQGFSPGPESLVAEVTGTSLEVVSPVPSLPNQNRSFYRLRAVDSLGTVGAASDCLELPHPFVHTEPPVRASVGEPYVYSPGILAATKYDRLPHQDSLIIEDLTLPPWLSHAAGDSLVGTPGAGHEGLWPVALRIADSHGGEIEQHFTLVVEGEGGSQQSISLAAGCNPISWSVESEIHEPALFFADILGHLEYAMALRDTSLYYLPSLPESSSLDSVSWTEGYWLRMREADTLRVQAAVVEPCQVRLPVEEGWNLLSFLPPAADSVSHAFASLGDHLQAVLGVDEAGAAYDPALPQFNTLVLAQPGHAYWVKVDEADTLVYPNDSAHPVDTGGLSVDFDRSNRKGFTATPTPYWASLYGSGLLLGEEPAPAGASIEVYDPDGILCGAGQLEEPGTFSFLPVWSDDPVTTADEGAGAGDELILLIAGCEVLPPPVYGAFGERIEVTGELLLTSVDGGDLPAVSSVRMSIPAPNPGRRAIEFRLYLPEKQHIILRVFSPSGRLVRTLIQGHRRGGESIIFWDGTDDEGRSVAPGIYLVSLEHASGRVTQKVVLAR